MTLQKASILSAAAALGLMLGGCDKKSDAAADPAVQAAIKADEKKWNEQFKSKDVEGLLSHYADDALFVAPGLAPASGSTAIRKAYAGGLNDNYFQLSFASDRIDASSDLAYARGHFNEQYQDRASGKIVTESGTYITVYKKQADVGWKVIEDIAVADPATRKEKAPEAAKKATMISM